MSSSSSKEDDEKEEGTLEMYEQEKKSTLHRTMTQEERQLLHPLEINDRLAFETIKTVRLDFITGEAEAPIPRCQGLPSHAFGRLTGRSILVSVSHAWFFQNHPDPYGQKLDFVKNVFAPQLRKRYPHTDIQVFFDFVSLPQEPRTSDEEEVYLDAVSRMCSVYIYSDVILLLETDLPEVDMTVHRAEIDISKYEFCDFVDTVQVLKTTSTDGPQVFDSIVSVGNLKLTSQSEIAKYNSKHEVTYLKRPFGRPNTASYNKRGWIYFEHILGAVKAAAADKSQFDDIVISNSECLTKNILLLSERIRNAARKQKTKPKALRALLSEFHDHIRLQTFTLKLDSHVVPDIMSKFLEMLSNEWKGEVEKQKSMSKRAREILLRWGCFSEDYVERAELLCDSGRTNRRSWMLLSVLIGVILPMIAVLPFILALEGDGEDPSRDGLVVSSMWLGCIQGYVKICFVCDLIVLFAHLHCFL